MYNKHFFNNQQAGSVSSAEIIVPFLMTEFKPRSVIDIGCGIGTWLEVFNKYGITSYIGLDSHEQFDLLKIPLSNYLYQDLNEYDRTNDTERWDMAISLETAEHLQPNKSAQFVKALTSASDIVVFSAAIPYQGGRNHINERWQSFWTKLFKQQGYVCVDCIRPVFWNNKNVEWWYLQNMLVFINQTAYDAFKFKKFHAVENIASLDIVHPRRHVATSTYKHITVKQWLLATKMLIKRLMSTKQQRKNQIYIK